MFIFFTVVNFLRLKSVLFFTRLPVFWLLMFNTWNFVETIHIYVVIQTNVENV